MDEDALFEEALAETLAEAPGAPEEAPQQDAPALPELGVLDGPVRTAAAIGGGVWKSIFETKDFFTGEPAEEDKSDLRRRVEGTQRQLAKANPAYGVVGSVSQFAAGMVGLGKLMAGGRALSVGGRILSPATKAGKAALESAKAASVGAVAFDPWEERLSNLVEEFPSLSNPVTRYLAADPNDSAAEGRLKSVIESLGMDAVLIGAFKAVKALRAGDSDGAVEALATVKLPEEPEPSVAPPALPQDNSAPLPIGRPANDLEPGRDPTAQGNLATAGQPPLQAPAVDARETSVGLRFGDEAAPPEPSNSNLFNDDTLPGEGVANDNVGFGKLFEESTAPKAEPPAQVEVPPQAATTEGAPAADAGSITRVQNATEGMGGKLPKDPKVLEVPEPTAEALLKDVAGDAEALSTYGSREAAEEAGHAFGKGGSIPWQKLNTPEDLSAFLARTADAMAPQLDAAKGGKVLTDERLRRLVNQRVSAYGDDPSALLAVLEQSGVGARTLAVNMEAADAVATKLADEAYQVAAKIAEGRLDDWGGDRAAAVAEFAKRTGMAMTTFGHARSMLSNSGRTLRRARGDLERLSFADIKKLQDLPTDRLLALVQQTKGDTKALREALSKPGLLARAQDAASYLLVNNLLWGWKTHVVNLTTNAYMLAARPLEKALGSVVVGGAEGAIIRKRALYEYTSMKSTLVDSFQAAAMALKLGDSILDPHQVESFSVSTRNGTETGPWKPVKNVGDLAHNALSAAWQAVGIPTRALGGVDELVKQIRYRSVVLADAQVEADALALTGTARHDHVMGRLGEAFDANGAATNTRAIQEARIATFQQELLEGTAGRAVQGFVSNYPASRFVLPFVKTPTNVLRYGIKYSPGINMLQTEYRQALSGKQGPEAQAQAAGQMSLGLLAVATAATMVADGRFTGSGPKDPKARATLVASGWQPNSVVWRNEDGTTTYFPLGRFDPVGLPFGIIADLMDLYQHPDKLEDGEVGIDALAIAVAKQMTDKTYLQNLNQFFQAMADPEKSMGKFANNMAGNMVPFSSGLKAYANGDPYMREVRSMVDGMMSRVPGLSETLPVRYDPFGDPITVRKGLATTVEDDVVDNEMVRMGNEFGSGILVPPAPSRNRRDLRDIVIEDGRTAYEALQVYSGHPGKGPSLKSSLARIIGTEAYGKAPDGPATVPGTRQWMLSGIVVAYRELGQKRLQAESEVYRAAMLEDTMKVRAAYTANTPEAKAKSDSASLEALAKSYGLTLGQ